MKCHPRNKKCVDRVDRSPIPPGVVEINYDGSFSSGRDQTGPEHIMTSRYNMEGRASNQFPTVGSEIRSSQQPKNPNDDASIITYVPSISLRVLYVNDPSLAMTKLRSPSSIVNRTTTASWTITTIHQYSFMPGFWYHLLLLAVATSNAALKQWLE